MCDGGFLRDSVNNPLVVEMGQALIDINSRGKNERGIYMYM